MAKRGPKDKSPASADDWKQFEKLCALQCSLHEIASYFDIDPKSLQTKVKNHYGEKFSQVFRDKRGLGKISLRRKQFEQALAGNTKMLIHLGAYYLDQKGEKNYIEKALIEKLLKD